MKLNNSGDKKGHHYVPLYEKYFSPICSRVKNILEIGVRQGESILAWKDFFKNANIYGIDIGWPQPLNYQFIDKLNAQERIFIYKGDQSCPKLLEDFTRTTSPMDIVVDDGSHILKHQQFTFFNLFDHLTKGGYYIIEDLHTSHYPHMIKKYGLNDDGSNSTYLMFENFQKKGKLKSIYHDRIFLEEEIKIEFLNKSIVFLQKI